MMDSWSQIMSITGSQWAIKEAKLLEQHGNNFELVPVARLPIDDSAFFDIFYHTYYRLAYVHVMPEDYFYNQDYPSCTYDRRVAMSCCLEDLEFHLTWLQNMTVCKICHVVTNRFCTRRNGTYCKSCYVFCAARSGRIIGRAMLNAWITPGNEYFEKRMNSEVNQLWSETTSAQTKY